MLKTNITASKTSNRCLHLFVTGITPTGFQLASVVEQKRQPLPLELIEHIRLTHGITRWMQELTASF